MRRCESWTNGWQRSSPEAGMNLESEKFPGSKKRRARRRVARAERLMQSSGVNGSWVRGEFEISTDPARIDLATVHNFLTHSYWAKGIPVETAQQSIQNSLCFGVYQGKQQVGFARIITDYATFAYLADVFILEQYRGRGLSKWLMECIVAHPQLQGLRRWMLQRVTRTSCMHSSGLSR